MATEHIADAEPTFKVLNIDPDMCFVNGAVVPFEIYRELPPELSDYSPNVNARGCKVLHVDSIVQGVIGNAGSGVISGVSQGPATTSSSMARRAFASTASCARGTTIWWG